MMQARWIFVLWISICLGGVTTAEEGFAPAPEQVTPLLVGQKLPTLVLQTADGKTFDLNAENSEKPLVVVFYRGHW
jgi:cytochrome oxidase Cu insertion factor (SCO1/SenC/PrrC family)